VSGLKGDPSKLQKLGAKLRALPVLVAQASAERIAPALTAQARATFDAGETPYGDAWAPGADGQRVTLRQTGALASGVRFVAVGTRVRAVLGARYAKYQVGRRRVLPGPGAALPPAWRAAVDAIVRDELDQHLARGAA